MQRSLKWIVDRVLALFMLIAMLPLLLFVALLVWTSAGRPLLHRQTRLGRGGRPFTLRKFRTLAEGGGPSIAPDGDARILPAGRFLRRWRLDELPQLFNVLAGDMSLVGPRPLPPRHADALPAGQREALLRVRPGITGPASLAFLGDDAALSGRSDPERDYLEKLLPAKADLELDYLAHWNLLSDIRLLARTLVQLWSPRAHRRSRERTIRLLENRTGS